MPSNRWPKFRFRLSSLFVLMLGIAIGYSLNIQTWQLLVGQGNEAWMGLLPTYVIEPPDILLIESAGTSSELSPPISGQHLVGPDGNVNLGVYGQVFVAGKTIEEVREAVKKAVSQSIESPQVFVDILVYNSKFYYLITKGNGSGDNVTRVPITGNETVLDAIATIGGLESPDTTDLWIARPSSNGLGQPTILPVDWNEVSGGSAINNYQLLPNDRVFISPKSTIAAN